MNNISCKEAMRKKFLEKYPEPTKFIYAHQQQELFEKWHAKWGAWQAAYESCLSEFEQVGVMDKFDDMQSVEWAKSFPKEAQSYTTPLFTRRLKD
jgi:hypothetical protein